MALQKRKERLYQIVGHHEQIHRDEMHVFKPFPLFLFIKASFFGRVFSLCGEPDCYGNIPSTIEHVKHVISHVDTNDFELLLLQYSFEDRFITRSACY